MTWLMVALGAAVGAPLRYLLDRAVQARHASAFPWGTFAVNAVGCVALGVLAGAVRGGAAGPVPEALLGTGLCGALTTYSTFSYESLRLVETGRSGLALANVLGTLAVGLTALAAGFTVTRGLVG
ncbi:MULTISPECIES: fluoride efflux transporter CrcB [unclassified Streptomyces]|uniref:fluoride efflux transporter CrcB n=1 Tax=unclassified Streptomyces TaxID=2593676 RepID=UPI0022B6598F|nr:MULTISPECIES: fluoride efflux transporter CrcB [unclassified Streptomyces]MCZ7415296.1 fluoride efflux transporter CrcB [Streptomyces sp. WMMC897]MCZ7432237.1 fluoride efflux transporter CrcB [Streptomyces sp. WMMC1477]